MYIQMYLAPCLHCVKYSLPVLMESQVTVVMLLGDMTVINNGYWSSQDSHSLPLFFVLYYQRSEWLAKFMVFKDDSKREKVT